MNARFSEAASYGYVTILISKSPRIDVLADIIERGEAVDIPTAVARGILSTEYLKLGRYEDVEGVDSAIHSFLLELIKNLSRCLPTLYNNYLETFVEVYDIDRVVAVLETRSTKTLNHMFSRLEATAQSLIRGGKSLQAHDYGRCFESKSIVECMYRVYLNRVVEILRSLCVPSLSNVVPTDIRKSTNIVYLFVLARLYSYEINMRRLGLDKDRVDVSILLKNEVSRNVIGMFSNIATNIEREAGRNPSLALVYEAKYINRDARDILLYSPTLLDRLTYLLIEKFYESKLVRYIAMKKYRWR